MKTLALLIPALLLILLSLGVQAAALPALGVETVDPNPVEPGGDLSITITITNNMDSTLSGFEMTADYGDAFILKSIKEGSDTSGGYSLCNKCKIENSYFFSVKTDTPSGVYPIFFRATKQGDAVESRADIEVKGKPNIVIESMVEGLDSLVPKSSFTLVLDIRNIGTGAAKEVKIYPDSTTFIPLGSSVKTIDILMPKSSKPLSFDLLVSDELAADSYNIPFIIEYKTEKGENLTETQDLGVRVVNKGQINVQSVKIASATGSSVINAGEPFTVIARLENIGEGDANFVEAGLECPFSAGQRAFIGKLEKDEDSPAVFDLSSGQAGRMECDLVIKYQDDTGKNTRIEKLSMDIRGPALEGLALVIIILLAVGFIFRKRIARYYRSFRKKT